MTVPRAALAAALALGLLAAPLTLGAQETGKIYRLGVLAPSASQIQGSFWEGLRDLGWIEGKNFIVERRYSDTNPERYPDLASELVRLNVDVIVSVTTPPTAAAKEATSTIPIVFIDVADPLFSSFVTSFPRPGGNVTGLSSVNVEMSGKRVELLRAAFPRLSRVAVLACCFGTPADAVVQKFLDDTTAAAKAMKVSTLPIAVNNLDNPAALFTTIVKDRADGLIVLPIVALVWLTVENDRESKVPSIVQPDDALIGSPFHDPAITPRSTGETDTDRTREDCDLK